MGRFIFHKTEIEGVCVIEPTVFGDERGYFFESYHAKAFSEGGISDTFVQDNQSRSKKGVLRGLHFQEKYPQSKLVRVLEGEIFDVAVDLRKDSASYGRWTSVILTNDGRQIYMPEGIAHGFLVLSENATVVYKCNEFYHAEDERGIRWNDPVLNIAWPHLDCPFILSKKDCLHPFFSEWEKSTSENGSEQE